MSAGLKHPTAPRNSKQAAKWKRYYERKAAWYADTATKLAVPYPNAAAHAKDEAERYAEGARLLSVGEHPNQISGKWV